MWLSPIGAKDESSKLCPLHFMHVVIAMFAPPLAKLLHHDPVALDFVQIKLDRGARLGRCHIGGFDFAIHGGTAEFFILPNPTCADGRPGSRKSSATVP